MKELSIEEKAKAYDEAIEKAKNFIENGDERERTIAENIFAGIMEEFKDEKIRKAIIDKLTSSEPLSIDLQTAISWLEKQGEQNPQGKSALEAVKEEKVDNQNCVKPIDRVAPKFKVGDWVVRGKTIAQILDIQEQYYVGLDINGNDFTSSRFLSDDKIHLWTIEDAKDCDVLVTLDYILVFKEFLKNDGGISYCHYDFGAGNPQFIWFEDKNWYFGKEAIVHPATKEQRNLLFQKMKEAGYAWNVEKKELKKIEQKPANKIEPIFNVGDKIQYSKGCGTIMTIEKIENGEYIFGNNMGYTTIESGNKWHLIERNPVWSEKD